MSKFTTGSSKSDYSKKILKILAEKPAVSVMELVDRALGAQIAPKALSTYALTRSLKGLTEAGFVESVSSGQNEYARLTNEGKRKAYSIKLESGLVSTKWDGYWRMIMLDLPEERKSEREALRYLLKKAGFVCVKNSVWVSMYPYENLFINIKKDLGLTTEMMILVTDKIDEETEKELIMMF